jgi:DNA repair exonuclease SbcCD nuclease subunit
MIKSKVAIFSDLHLGLYGNSTDWHKIALAWADWIVGELTKKKIKDIFFLGDFFHNRSEISVHTVHVATEIISKFKDFHIYMIIGNHDAYYKNRSDVHSLGLLKGHDNITIIDSNFELSAFDKKMLFVPWDNEITDGKFDYMFGHFEIQSFKMNNFKVCDRGLNVNYLLDKSNTIFSGHFHNRNSKKYNKGSVHYVGNTFPMDFADVANDKGYHIFDIESGELEFFKNTVSPEFKKINLSDIKKYKENDLRGHIVKVIVDKEVDDGKLDKFKVYLMKFKPHQLTFEFNVNSKRIEDAEELDSVDISEQFVEFIDQLKLEEEKQTRVQKIIDGLYERNK